MAESSFPVLEQPLTDQQWGQVTLGLGSGVLGATSGNYAYTNVNNATNTAQLSAGDGMAQAIVSGYYHRIDADHTISLPAISSGTRTYYVGLTYDPLKHADPSGPVSITVTTSKPSGSGKVYLPLYEIVRQPNQLLSQATNRVKRVLIAPTLSVASIEELPDASTMMQGTLCQTSNLNMVWRASGSRWVPIGATGIGDPWPMGGWVSSIPVGGIQLNYLESGARVATADSVRVARTGSNFTIGTGWHPVGTFIPQAYRGAGTWREYAATLSNSNGGAAAGVARLHLESGELQFRLGSGSQTVTGNHSILFSASWVIA